MITLSRLARGLATARHRSFDELRDRARQAARVYLERLTSSTARRADGARALGYVLRHDVSSDAAAVHRAWRERELPPIHAALASREATVRLLREREPGHVHAIVAHADRIVAGRFDLLGHTDLSFGDPIDWHLDPVLGVRAPRAHWSRIAYLDPAVVGDHKLVWELNRHHHLVTLGQAWVLTGDARYADTFVTHVEGWLEANPPGIGVNWASSLEVAFRAIAWTWALACFRDAPQVTPILLARMVASLARHGRHLERYLSTWFSPNTHLTGEALGLLYLGTCVPELRDAARWRDLGEGILAAQLPRHVHPDGSYFEQTTYYHRYTLDFYLHALRLAPAGGALERAAVRDALARLARQMAWVQRPDGSFPLVGDDDGGRLLFLDDRPSDDARPSLSTAAAVLGEPTLAFASGGLAAETLWLLGPEGAERLDALHPEPPREGSRGFADGGYFVMRDGWSADANWALIDAGPHGAMNCGHAHADALAVELAVRGRRVLVDPGTYTYTVAPAERDAFRHTRVHNTVTLDGLPSSRMDGPFHWAQVAGTSVRDWHATPSLDLLRASHDGYATLPAPATHERTVLFVHEGWWLLRDRIAGAGTHVVRATFQLAEGLEVAIDAGGATVSDATTAEPLLRLVSLDAAGHALPLAVEDGWVSRRYGTRTRATRVACESRVEGDAEVLTFLLPVLASGEFPAVAVRGEGGARVFAVSLPGREECVATALPSSDDPSMPLAGEAALAWWRAPVGAELPSEAVLLDARALHVARTTLFGSSRPAPLLRAARAGAGWSVHADDPRRVEG